RPPGERCPSWASMEPLNCLSGRIPYPPQPSYLPPCFNGAAQLLERKARQPGDARGNRARFNGAAQLLERKGARPPHRRGQAQASMEPLNCLSGRGFGPARTRSAWSRFNGAAQSLERKVELAHLGHLETPGLQW